MKNILFFLVFSFITTITQAQDRIVTAGTIRYDFELVGDHASVMVVHKQTKSLPFWGGQSHTSFLPDEMGNFRYSVFYSKTEKLFYQKGFSPLFWEWQYTPEALDKSRSFYHSAHFPSVSDDVILKIENRDSLFKWSVIFTDTIKLDDPFLVKEKPSVPLTDTLRYSGPASEKIDLVILSEGYTQGEMQKFLSDARRLTDSLFIAEPFCRYTDRFNIFAIEVPSVESGTDMPELNRFRNTAFNSHFHTFSSPRYLTTSDMKPVYDAVDGAGWDHIILLVNSDRYGGGGFYNFFSICTTDNIRSPFVFIHEFGHSFAGLGDEYFSSAPAEEPFYSSLYEPWEPNLTTLADFPSKWGGMIEPGTPVPTPRNDDFTGKVGVFEGGGYQATGVFSPMMSCWMKEHSAGRFCPVCRKAIEDVIIKQSRK